MPASKVAVSMDEKLLTELDRLVAKKVFASRSQAVQISVEEKISRLKSNRLARECAKLDPREERAMAEEGFQEESRSWPEY